MKIIFSGFLWIIISSYIFSQTGNRSYSAKGILTGEVIDENQGIPLEYVTISLLDSNDSILVTGTITNAEGKFQLTGLDFGNYFIDISFVGYRPLRIKNIQISPGNANVSMGKIKFSPAVIAMDGVEVIAEKSQVEYKIDKKVINVGKDLVSAGGSAVEALENIPSVQVDIEGNVSLRGSSNFKVVIDGKPSVLQGSEELQQIPAS